jgi:SNF2 family DNA or RNA helicase
MGLNLQKANKTIYFSLTESAELWMQAHKRTNRIGQERPCFYYILLCENSIEELILDCLERGVDFTNELFEECE